MNKLSCNDIRQKWINFFEAGNNNLNLKHKFFKSASLVPDNPTLLLNSAGMVPFIPYFIGAAKLPEPPRAVSIQKCARVGGKDSDLANIGYTPRHHSFFEMLGNFSFGDYFKQEAIAMAWEFVTKHLELDNSKLYVSVFEGDSEKPCDEEAYSYWQKLLKNEFPNDEIEKRIWKFGAKDNFWGPPGPSGPCGPCSEIYYDLGEGPMPAIESPEFEDRFIEIWNLVFMEFEKTEEGDLKPLAQKNIDTGAGLERIALVKQNVNNTFETDELASIIKCTEKEINEKVKQDFANSENQSYLKIIVDHLRCSCFLIADGVRPSNLSRGYVLRMLIRRAARFLYKLNLKESKFLSHLATKVINIYSQFYSELEQKQESIIEVLAKEEEAFAKTIDKGLARLNEKLEEMERSKETKLLDGPFVFDLYSTYGFPLELTEDIAQEKSLGIDYEAYNKAKEQHSKASSSDNFNNSAVAEQDLIKALLEYPETEFLGYDLYENRAEVLAIFNDTNQEIDSINISELINSTSTEDNFYNFTFKVLLDKTSFYAESGGQLADKGFIIKENLDSKSKNSNSEFSLSQLIKVSNVKAKEARYLHFISLKVPKDTVSSELESILKKGDKVTAQINKEERELSKIHHSSCHLLQSALRKILGDSVQQAGSQVGSEYTRFDFNFDRALKAEEIKDIENQIQDWVKQAMPVSTVETDFDSAIEMGALAFFEDKYEGNVRVLKMGNDSENASMELCGGTHVANTKEIELVKIASESSVAAGIRRIKLFAQSQAEKWLQEEQAKKEAEAAEQKRKAEEKEAAKKAKAELLNKARESLDKILAKAHSQENRKYIICHLNEIFDSGLDADTIKELASDLKTKIESENHEAWLFFISEFQGKVVLLGSCSKNLAKEDKYRVNAVVKEAAAICKGGGGGRPDFAQAGAKDPSKIKEAVEKVKSLVF